MASGSFKTGWGQYSKDYELRVEWSSTSNTAANTSTVKVVVKFYCPYSCDMGKRYNNKVTINGVEYDYTSPAINTSGGETFTLATINSGAIAHNADGSKSISISAQFRFNASLSGVQYGVQTASKTVTLDKIPRAATITSAPNFNDEENPTIKYSNSAGNAVTSLRACISLDGSKDDVAYRDISKTGTSYTFNLTDAERNVLRNATTTSNSRTVRFYVETVIGGNTYRNSVSKTFTIINANPVVNPTMYDTDAAVIALTGNKNITMKNYSNIYYALNATAQKGATIKSYKVSEGITNKTTATGTFTNIQKGVLYYTVIDSRGNKKEGNFTQPTFAYTELTAKVKGDLTTGGIMTVTLSGNYFNSTFGSVTNTLTVEYRIKEGGGSWGAWQTATPTLGAFGKDLKYTATVTKEGLDYKKTYTIQSRVTDKIKTVTSAEYQIITYPIFDWGEDDFKFNVPVALSNGTPLQGVSGSGENVNMTYITTGTSNLQVGGGAYAPTNIFINTKDNAGTVSINGKAYGVNRVLWSGAYYMTEGQTANLTEPVSAQTSGIILVFSRYDITNSEALNEHFSSHFIPKQLVALQEGKGSVFNMNTATYSYAGSKYLYIDDTAIRGNSNNDAVGTGENGISYNNNRYVLRYVIGV